MKILRKTFAAGAALCCLSAAAGLAYAQAAPPADGPWLGVWKYNPEKSATANNRPAPSGPQGGRVFRMIQVKKDAFKFTIETTPASGGPMTVSAELIGKFDGKEYIEVGNTNADANKFRI